VAQHVEGSSARPVRDCEHSRVHHEHGTRLAYVLDRCGCGPCRAANTAAERRRRQTVAYGRPTGLVDSTAARAHVLDLRRQGLSVARIAELAGVGHGALVALVYGRSGRGATRHIRPQTEQRLLEVRFDAWQQPAGRRVAGTGTRRRLQALAASGWSVPALAASGWSGGCRTDAAPGLDGHVGAGRDGPGGGCAVRAAAGLVSAAGLGGRTHDGRAVQAAGGESGLAVVAGLGGPRPGRWGCRGRSGRRRC